jgi:chorismate dehydratase
LIVLIATLDSPLPPSPSGPFPCIIFSMTKRPSNCSLSLHIGAVTYLNTKPLVHGLDAMLPQARISYDLPSRLADRLSRGELDLALVPSIELAGHSDWRIVSDACIGCKGPVLSVKLLFRVPVKEVRTLALDEGSRTSAALAQVLLWKIHQVQPQLEPLPIGGELDSTDADAVLLIGDRAIGVDEQAFIEVWDLGDQWCRWAKRPFVFAMWVVRADVETDAVEHVLEAARDHGCDQFVQIARQQSKVMHLEQQLILSYFENNLNFHLGPEERDGMDYFFQQAGRIITHS